ncbi:YycH family regulatory protein [Staphylococcus americanisciuri]|uniref:Two-component system activity regulator YycH n=1 Tax=Staphylococcus americanisciuri TaxID=2973940 RepID=A0ABT2F064_9STAP|nr:two-component system activity regulator YycH [Staphylococcus americanisciuri]MCS4485843.1 two-component system activity regulator YycH [Staphylococcus americanisciuri]
MKIKEYVKSAILCALVFSSIVLTLLIWNFSPDLTNVENEPTKEVSKSIGPRFDEEISQVVAPLQMVQVQGMKVEGMPATSEVNHLTDVFHKQQVKKVVYIENEQVLLLRELSDHFVVLDYPTDIPLSMYLSDVLDLQAKVPSQFKFDRLIYDIDETDDLVVYAIDAERHRAVKMTTTVKVESIKTHLKELKTALRPYMNISTNEDTVNKATYIYAQKNPENLKTYRTIFNHINVEDLNAILFDDTPIVRTTKSGNTIYNNNTGVVNYDPDSKTYHYTNLSEDERSTRDMNISIPRTFDYINEHGGFTDDFRLFQSNSHQGLITYQMFLNGRPIFYPNELNQIHVSWGEHGIFEYSRGLLKTNVTIDNGQKAKRLPTAEDVRASLASNSTIDFRKVEQLVVGYRMVPEKEPDDRLEIQVNSQFEPTWYIKHAGTWYEYNDGELIEQ